MIILGYQLITLTFAKEINMLLQGGSEEDGVALFYILEMMNEFNSSFKIACDYFDVLNVIDPAKDTNATC